MEPAARHDSRHHRGAPALQDPATGPRRQAPAAGPYARVVVSVDFSAQSAVALATAMQIAPGAEFTAVHAFDVPFEGGLRRAGVTDEDIWTYRKQAREQALGEISALLDAVGGEPGRFFRIVEPGDPSFMILEKAQALDADLIVIGDHGRSLVEGVLLGTVTRHVLADARRDVLVVRTPGGHRQRLTAP